MTAFLTSLYGLYIMTALSASTVMMTWQNSYWAGLTLFLFLMTLWQVGLKVTEGLVEVCQELRTLRDQLQKGD